MECFKGYVNKIVYRNEDNGYTVFELSIDDDDDLTCVGTIPYLTEGEFVEVTGDYTEHAVYGQQLKVTPVRTFHLRMRSRLRDTLLQER